VVGGVVEPREATDSADDLEARRVAIEEARLELERVKADREARGWWVARVGVAIPLLAAVVAAWVSVDNARETDRNDFELKAAEIVFQTDDPYATEARARALSELFPGHLSKDFGKTFRPGRYGTDAGAVGAKKELLQLLVAHPRQARAILSAWQQLFPDDKWPSELKGLADRLSQ
jgi:hypothetical protein